RQQLSWNDLGFTCEKSTDYYEFICQLPTEVEFYYGLVERFQNNQSEYIGEVNANCAMLLLKTGSMMDNTNKYLDKYFKEKIIKEAMTEQIFNELNLQLESLNAPKELIHKLGEIKIGWCIDFSKK
ncbi:MAG: hypothetical protein ACRC37_01265, partial [Lentisphaeria bacterium]